MTRPAAVFVFLCMLAADSYAALGTGWIETTYTKKIHLDDEEGLQTFAWSLYRSVGVGTVCADYSYDGDTDTETFRLFDNRTNRSEIRLYNEYAAGRRQFEGYVTFYSPLDNESLFQIFGNTDPDRATLTMMRGYSGYGGSITPTSTGGTRIVSNCYGIEKRINIIHDQDNRVYYYVDGILKAQLSENDPAVNYWKYGCYGTVYPDTVPAVVRWRAVRTYRDGNIPGTDSSISAAPSALTTVPGGSVFCRIDVSDFAGDVVLSLIDVPDGVTANLSSSTILGGQSSAVLTIAADSSLPLGSYPITIQAVCGPVSKSTVLELGLLPPDWTDRDIGSPGRDGGANCSGGVFAVRGSGADIWGTTDSFNYAWQTVSGDVTLSAHVQSQLSTHPWAKSGLMIRQSPDADAPYVGLYITPDNGVSMQYRHAAGGLSVDLARATDVAVPVWLRLSRESGTLMGFYSADGITWTHLGDASDFLSDQILAGPAVCSHDNTQLSEAVFSHLSVVADPKQPTGLHGCGDDGIVRLFWNENTEAGFAGFTLYRSRGGTDGFAPIASGLNNGNYVDESVENNKAYYYSVTAAGQSGKESVFCAPVEIVPHLPKNMALNKAVTASSFYGTALPVYAVDGQVLNYPQIWYSAQDGSDPEPWIMIDLEETSTADRIAIYNWPNPGTYSRNRDFDVDVLDAGGLLVWSNYDESAGQGELINENNWMNSPAVIDYVFEVPACGRYIIVTKRSGLAGASATANISELEIFGRCTALLPVTGLSAASADSAIRLSWDVLPNEPAASYSVYRRTESGSYIQLASHTAEGRYEDLTAACGIRYYYTITVTSGEGIESRFCPEASAILLVSADFDAGGKVDLSDFSLLSRQWLSDGSAVPTADIAPDSGDGSVNILDLTILADQWLFSGYE